MIVVTQSEMAAPAAPRQDGPSVQRPDDTPIDLLVAARPACVSDQNNGDIVVCGRRDGDQFRLQPLPPLPPSDTILTRPLRIQVAPGVSLGFQKGGGFGVRAEFGPGRKTDEAPH